MVPKVAGKGTSFKGAGAYYLHDKGADTSERVAFTHTENLPTNNPDLALRSMAYTAMHQDQIKAAAGVKATGRKSAQSVYTYSLSWAPDEEPTRDDMIAAGQETLEALGLEGHEVLMVAHDDEPHPHLHLIVNRVHPETGVMAPLSKDFLGLSRWAEDYERRQGEIRCDQRVENNEKRRNGEFVRYHDGFDVAAFHRARKMQREAAFQVRQAESANLAATHRGERQALADQHSERGQELFEQKQERTTQIREHIRELNRPRWAELFRRQREERDALNEHQKSAYLRLRYFVKHRGHDVLAGRDAGLKETMQEAMRAVFGRDNPHGALSRKHRAERQALGSEIRQQRRAAERHVDKDYRHEQDQPRREQNRLARLQQQETLALAEQHSRESQQQARAIKEGQELRQHSGEAGQGVTDEFERRAWEQVRKAKERRDQGQQRGKTRDGGRERDR